MSQLYDIKNYTDAQLYAILDMDNPTDRELEAKIIHLIRKYDNIQNEDGQRLSTFFKQVYDHFFDNEDDEIIEEGFETNDSVLKADSKTSTIQTEQIGFTAEQTSKINSVQTFDYSKDKLQINPLLKQTIKRVISIDSQYRNIKTNPITTNFSFDLSEPLKDVLSLKLYSIQIPYTWYIINKNYGANFFYLKSNNPKLIGGNHDYQISIPIGNYGAADLVTTINKSFQTVISSTASDIQFSGNTIASYNNFDSKTTFNLNFTKTYNEAYYQVDFSNVMPSNVPDSSRRSNIAAYLGFNYSTYDLNSISSVQSLYKTEIITSENQNAVFKIDNSNNYFTINQYLGPNVYSPDSVLNTYKITLPLTTGYYTRPQIIPAVKLAIQNANIFTSNSTIEQIDIIDSTKANVGNSYFKLTIMLDRYKVAYKPNSKLYISFPTETPLENIYDSNVRTIWTNQAASYRSCFFFDNSTNEFCEIISEIPGIQSSFTLDLSSNMKMNYVCNTIGYTNGSNNLTLSIVPSPISQNKYTLYEYRDRINASFVTANTTYGNIFLPETQLSVLNNFFDMKIQMNKTFTQTNCILDIPETSLLHTYFGFPIAQTDFSTNSNIISHTFIPQDGGYDLSNRYLFTLKTNGTNGNGMSDISVNLPADQILFDTYDLFAQAIQTAIKNVEISTIIGTNTIISNPLFNSTFLTTKSDTTFTSELTIKYSYSLSEINYSIYYDSSQNNWSQFDISSSYDLSSKHTGSYAEITGIITGGDQLTLVSPNNTFTIETNTFLPNIPNNIITIDLSTNVSYPLNDLYVAINAQLASNPLTYGSSISTYVASSNKSYTKFRLNINDIYTTDDYYLDFYDPISFSTCLPTSSSIQNTTWDSTVGWILGFRDYTQYYLSPSYQTTVLIGNTSQSYYSTSSNGKYIVESSAIPNSLYSSYSISLTSDTTLNTNLYNYFLISLDDYIQNHLNDGLVTITRNQTAISTPSYAYSTTMLCDPGTNTKISRTVAQSNSDNVTAKQLYALNQTLQSNANQVKTYSSGPFVKDLFGLIPIKPGTNGASYIEFGGTLQNQERVYFGPVNIRKMSIQLLNDRGDVVDLNGSNWSFSFICEQLYRDNLS